MQESFDKLIIRFFFTVIICIALYLYKIGHNLLYPSARRKLIRRIDPSKNPPDTIHLFSRLLGLGIMFSGFHFYLSRGIVFALFDFFIQISLIFFIYLITIFIIESIVLYNFEFSDEITKRKSYPYAIISFAHSIGISLLLKTVLTVAHDSIPLTIFLWLFAVVIIGFATKTFKLISKLSFNRLVIQKHLGISFSYLGFFLGWAIMITSALDHPVGNLKWYPIFTILKILLCLIIYPLFRLCIMWIYKIKDTFDESDQTIQHSDREDVLLGHGIYEGCLFLICSYLTTVITGNINFGTFYPVF